MSSSKQADCLSVRSPSHFTRPLPALQILRPYYSTILYKRARQMRENFSHRHGNFFKIFLINGWFELNAVLKKVPLGSCGPGSSVGIATGYGLDGPGSNPDGRARFSAPVQRGPGAHPVSCTVSTGYFPGLKSGRGVTLTRHTLLVPWSRKSRAIPLLPLWAVRPVQSLSACYNSALYLYLTFGFLQRE